MKPESRIPQENLNDLSELCASTGEGDYAELGVYQGGSAMVFYEIAEARGRKLHLFDTFEGIPEKTEKLDILSVGDFKDVNIHDVKRAMPNAEFHVGIFPLTMPKDLGTLAFVHIDCDQYATCKAAIELFWPLLSPGGVMAFDDWPFAGIQKAVKEQFVTPNKIQFTKNKVPFVRKE